MQYAAKGESPASADLWTALTVQAPHSAGMYFNQCSGIQREKKIFFFVFHKDSVIYSTNSLERHLYQQMHHE